MLYLSILLSFNIAPTIVDCVDKSAEVYACVNGNANALFLTLFNCINAFVKSGEANLA